jgi:hypothetical protein
LWFNYSIRLRTARSENEKPRERGPRGFRELNSFRVDAATIAQPRFSTGT